jgi:2-amino-4-hydroxy-6-hydroxymethyldihydropteridine diphosphokinase/dihydropteroate synthase
VPASSKQGRNLPSALNKSAKKIAYIALGSNLGDRIGWIEKACNEMSARGIKVTRTSSLWETEPMYVLNQGSFINGACEVSSAVSSPRKAVSRVMQLID